MKLLFWAWVRMVTLHLSFPDCINTSSALNSQNKIVAFEDKHLDYPRISLSLNEILKAGKII